MNGAVAPNDPSGGLGNNVGMNPLLPGDDDGLVTVQSTRLAGAADFLVLPVVHASSVDTPMRSGKPPELTYPVGTRAVMPVAFRSAEAR